MNWPGLLNWSLNQQSKNSPPEGGITPMSKEDANFLRAALEEA